MRLYFSDFFEVSEEAIEQYGAFNISLLTDLPLFVDPFLLFNSDKEEYQQLHQQIIDYVAYLRDLSLDGDISPALVRNLYRFPEIKQNWLGYSRTGNSGRGLGARFASALDRNLNRAFVDFGDEEVTKGSHLERLALIDKGVGRDSISDFTTNLIHGYLLEYTQAFARKYIQPKYRQLRRVPKAVFNDQTHSWVERTYDLPIFDGDYVLLTPVDLLTKIDTWINHADLVRQFHNIPYSIPNDELRAKISHYFNSALPKKPTAKERTEAKLKTIAEFPEIIDYYIRYKEDRGDEAEALSEQNVNNSKQLYIDQFRQLPQLLADNTEFYKVMGDTKQEAYMRVMYLKQVIEKNDGYRALWLDGKPVTTEFDLHVMYRLTWFATVSDVNHEVNNGRGPADYTVSRGAADKSIVEFKLAKNSKLEDNLKNQAEVYAEVNQTNKKIKAILFFTEAEQKKVVKILKKLGLSNDPDIILIDGRNDNKPSASTIRG